MSHLANTLATLSKAIKAIKRRRWLSPQARHLAGHRCRLHPERRSQLDATRHGICDRHWSLCLDLGYPAYWTR